MLFRSAALLAADQGLILVCGPTGSGKSSTLAAMLRHLNETEDLHVITLEDPVEYLFADRRCCFSQREVGIDVTSFPAGLKAALRQDPDVIMIGEIRDLETAQIAVQASLTGHLVLATLHTNDSASAVTRLMDMGIEPFLLSSSLLGVVAQRLVRKLCSHCKYEENGHWHAAGCDHCGHTGYSGRVGVYELLQTTDEIRSQIHHQASEADIRLAAQRNGMQTMREDGNRWLDSGLTTLEELLRVTKD